MKQLLLLSFIFLAIPAMAQTAEPTILATETGELQGTLLLPETAEAAAVPVALIIAGSGPTDRDGNNPMIKNNSLKLLAEGLAEQGIATLRYDKRGVAKSAAAATAEADLRFEHYIADAQQWVQQLKADSRFSSVSIIGHSEGALIGAVAAQMPEVARFVSLAGSALPANEIIREQLQRQPIAVYEAANPILEQLEKGETVADVPPMLAALFRPSVQPYMISWIKYKPQAEIAKLQKPVLVVQGTTDLQVPAKHGQLLRDAADAQVAYLEIAGMNHMMRDAPAATSENFATYSKPELPLSTGVVAGVAAFLEN